MSNQVGSPSGGMVTQAQSVVSIIEACQDSKLFKSWFKKKGSWDAWFVVLKAMFAIPLDPAEMAMYHKFTDRTTIPSQRVTELSLIVGRRGGKSQVTALIAAYLATLIDWTPYLSPGEKATIMIIAADRKQARVIFRYIDALLHEVPLLRPLVVRKTQEMFELKNRVNIEIMTANFRTIRGYTIVAALMDEIAFWKSDFSSNPDSEILDALRPAMSTIPGAMLMMLSSPYAQRGALYKSYKEYYGVEEQRRLIWKAPTWVMNPSVPQEIIDEAYKRDPLSADAEYGANFRKDVQILIPAHVIEACTSTGVYERPPLNRDHHYVAFVDPSGGSNDSFTLAIAHVEGQRRILDLVREVQAPFSPASVVAEFADVLKKYHIEMVVGDRYGGDWPAERFQDLGIEYVASDKTKSQIYLDFLPLINSGMVDLLDIENMRLQFTTLERRTSATGRDIVDHLPGARDDIANAAAGVLVEVLKEEPINIW